MSLKSVINFLEINKTLKRLEYKKKETKITWETANKIVN